MVAVVVYVQIETLRLLSSLLKSPVSDLGIEVKASGDIRSVDQAVKLMREGADRIGKRQEMD